MSVSSVTPISGPQYISLMMDKIPTGMKHTEKSRGRRSLVNISPRNAEITASRTFQPGLPQATLWSLLPRSTDEAQYCPRVTVSPTPIGIVFRPELLRASTGLFSDS